MKKANLFFIIFVVLILATAIKADWFNPFTWFEPKELTITVSDVCDHYTEIYFIDHYKNITYRYCIPPDIKNGTKEQCWNIGDTILDYKEKVITDKCRSNGFVNISGEIIGYKDFFCRIEENEIVCIAEKEGGRWNTCKEDGSVTCWKRNLLTNREEFKNSLKVNLIPMAMEVKP